MDIEGHATSIDDYVGAWNSLRIRYESALNYLINTGDITEVGVVDSQRKIEDKEGNPIYDLRMELDKTIGFVPNAIRRQRNFRDLILRTIYLIEDN